jgi:glycosyltransferase involved in cell wall biosynthesis
MNPLLTVITPVYNVAPYLDRCIQSILSQSYQEIELVLVDDGSTDASGAKCDEWASKDKRVIVLHKENGGVSSARNEALNRAKGEYITFVDPDDFIAQDTYDPNMKFLINHPEVDVLQYPYCHYIYDHVILDYHRPPSQMIIGEKDIFTNWWSGSPLGYVIWNKIYKRHLWSNTRFAVGHTSEDTMLIPNFVEHAKCIYISVRGLYYYQRSRKESYTYRYNFNKHLDLFYAHAAIFERFTMFLDMKTEKVLAFTRLFRRLIAAKQADGTADIQAPLSFVQQHFPSWYEILSSRHTEKLWLSVAKLLGPKHFIKMFISYLNMKPNVSSHLFRPLV